MEHGLRDRSGVIALGQEQVIDGNLEHIAALRVREVEQLAGLVLCNQPCVVGIQRLGLIEVLVIGDHRVKAPHQPVPEHREELFVDGLLTRLNPGREHVLGIDVLGGVRCGAVAVFGDAHDFSRHTEVFQHCIAHGNPALGEAQLSGVARPERLDIDVTCEGCGLVAVLHATVLLIPPGHESVALVLVGIRHQEHEGRFRVVVEEPLLELRGILVNLHLVRDALRDTEAAKEGVERIELLHHEHIVHRHVHRQARGGKNLVRRTSEVRGHLYPVRRHRPQLNRTPRVIPLDEQEALTHQQQVDFMQPPDGRACHLIQRVRLVHEPEEGVAGDFRLRTIPLNAQQFAPDVCGVAGNPVHDGKPGAFREHIQPFGCVQGWRSAPT